MSVAACLGCTILAASGRQLHCLDASDPGRPLRIVAHLSAKEQISALTLFQVRSNPIRCVLQPTMMIPTALVEAEPMLIPSAAAVPAAKYVTPTAKAEAPLPPLAAGRRAAVGCGGELGDVRGVSVAAEPWSRRPGRGDGGGAAAAHNPPALVAGPSAGRRLRRRRQGAAFPARGVGQRRGGCVPPVPQRYRDHARCGVHSCSSCCCLSRSVPRTPHSPASSCSPGTAGTLLPAAFGAGSSSVKLTACIQAAEDFNSPSLT